MYYENCCYWNKGNNYINVFKGIRIYKCKNLGFI